MCLRATEKSFASNYRFAKLKVKPTERQIMANKNEDGHFSLGQRTTATTGGCGGRPPHTILLFLCISHSLFGSVWMNGGKYCVGQCWCSCSKDFFAEWSFSGKNGTALALLWRIFSFSSFHLFLKAAYYSVGRSSNRLGIIAGVQRTQGQFGQKTAKHAALWSMFIRMQGKGKPPKYLLRILFLIACARKEK